MTHYRANLLVFGLHTLNVGAVGVALIHYATNHNAMMVLTGIPLLVLFVLESALDFRRLGRMAPGNAGRTNKKT